NDHEVRYAPRGRPSVGLASAGREPPPIIRRSRALKNREVLLHLPVGELDAVLVPLLPLQLDVAVEDVRAEGPADEVGARELVDRLAERLRQRDDPPLAALLGRQVVEVRLHRLRELVALLDPLEPGLQEAREGQVRIAGRVGATELRAGRLLGARLVE